MYLYSLAMKRNAVRLTLCIDLLCFKNLVDKLLIVN